jgi:steroid 5-alpha reductase family enzyme
MSYIYLTQIFIVFIYMNIWFLVAQKLKRNDIADVVWGPGFFVLSLAGLYYNPNVLNFILSVVIAVWAFRLAWHVGARFRAKKKEDQRYIDFRKNWGKHQALGAWGKVFMLQGFFMLLVAMPIIFASISKESGFGILNYFGLAVFLVGYAFEVVGDKQLKNFVSKPENKGKIIQSGLWRYSRHPNYFGEVLLWWGIWLFTWSTPYFLLGIIGPLTITFLILKVSGIPMLEKKYSGNFEFEQYKKRTSVFFPMPVKKDEKQK